MTPRALLVVTMVCSLPLLGPGTPAVGQNERPTSKPPGKAQRELASKSAQFGRVAKSSTEYKGAGDATDLAGVKKRIGQRAAFRGTVADVFSPRSHSVVLLNFAKDYKTALTAAVKKEHFAHFPDLNTLKGKEVVVTGPVVDYQGRPEVELTAPDQVRLVRWPSGRAAPTRGR